MLTRIKRLLKTLQYRWRIPAYRIVEESGLFDPDYYLEKNPDVTASAIDPLFHYVTIGFVEGRQPGPLFDLAYYLHQAPTLTEKTDIPLLHFLEKGRYCGFIPNHFVDLEYYSWKNPHIDFSKLDPFSHFLRKGGKTGSSCSPSPYFDPAFYCNLYPDAAKYTDNPRAAYEHFLKVGLPESRRPSIYFDTAWYLDKTPILHELGFNPINHYFFIGRGERKSPSPLFDPLYYAKTYGLEQCNDLFAHYLRCELIEDRQPCSWFDPGFYRETYLAGQQQRLSPLKHFLESGLANRLYPNREVEQLPGKPVISVVVPIYNVEIAQLNTCIRSVLYQSYPHWQLCLADDCSTDPRIRPLLAEWTAADSRIKVVFFAENSGISAATNAAARLADGSWLAFLDNDDELTQDALQVFVQRINSDPGDLYYSDEDLIGADGRQFSVFRKPGFNRELLLCHNYVTHCVVVKKALYEKVGGCAGEHNGAQDLDLFLKLSEQAEKIIHIPRVLYHWRASAASTSINHDQKNYADEAGRKSIANALARRGVSAEVLFTDLKFYYRAKRTVRPGLSVTLVIYCNRSQETLVPWLTELLAAAGYGIAQLLVVITNPALGALINTCGKAAGIDTAWHLVSEDHGPAQAFDAVFLGIKGELVAFIGGDSANFGDGWLSALVEYGQLPDIGMVGGRIEYPADHPDTVTPIPDCRIISPRYYARFVAACSVLMNGPHCPQEVLYVNGAPCLASRAALDAVGGFYSTAFPHLFAFHDLCCRLRHQGKKNFYTPYCRATSATDNGRGQTQGVETVLQEEQNRFREKWFDLLSQGDPFYNTGILADSGRSVAEFKTWLTGNRSTSHP